MLDATIKSQLKAYLERLQRPIELVATLDDSAKGQEMRALLNDIVECSDKVSLREISALLQHPQFTEGRALAALYLVRDLLTQRGEFQ